VNTTETRITEREIEILRLIAGGNTSTQIAAALSLSVETIKWYRKRLLQKTDSINSAEMINKVSQSGLL